MAEPESTCGMLRSSARTAVGEEDAGQLASLHVLSIEACQHGSAALAAAVPPARPLSTVSWEQVRDATLADVGAALRRALEEESRLLGRLRSTRARHLAWHAQGVQ